TSCPCFSFGELKRASRRLADGDAVAGSGRWHIAAAANDDRILEMLVEVIDVLDDPAVHRSRPGAEIEQRQVLHVLAQADTAGMRTHRDAELRRHQDDRE